MTSPKTHLYWDTQNPHGARPTSPVSNRHDYTPVVRRTKPFFPTVTEVKDDMKLKNENMKGDEMERFKV